MTSEPHVAVSPLEAPPVAPRAQHRAHAQRSFWSRLVSPAPGEKAAKREDPTDRQVTILEVLVVAAAVVFGLLGLVSLAAAHLKHNTPGVIFPVWVVLLAILVVVVGLFDRPTVRVDIPGLVIGALSFGLSAFMFFPGFNFATSDKDPGVYVGIASLIQRYHRLPFPDPLVSSSLPAAAKPSSVLGTWPGLWNQPGHPGSIMPQFYHLWPALLVAAKDVGGWTGLFNTGPLVGAIAVVGAVAIAKRIAGSIGAVVTGVIMATNMLQVWQAKYPSSEIYGQLLFVGALLAAVVAVRTGWKAAAAMSGLLLGIGFLERADGIVAILIAWAMLAALLAARRFDWRAGWLAIGLVVMLPYGFYQAYHLARTYTLTNNVPSFRHLLALMAVVAVVGALLAWHGGLARWLARQGDEGPLRFRLGVAFVSVCAVAMVVGFLRPRLFGAVYGHDGGRVIRTYDEITLERLSWFFSLLGFALLGAGIIWLACRRWRVENWIVLLITLPLFGLYAYRTHNSPYLMWDFRRFVTSVVPGMAILIGCGVVWGALVIRRVLPKAVASLAVVGVTVYFGVFGLSQSLPLRSHDESGGSLELVEQVATLAGAGHTGVYFWDPSGSCCDQPWILFGGSLWSLEGQNSGLAPKDPSQLAALLQFYLKEPDLSAHPVFYVGDGSPHAIAVAGVTLTPVRQFTGTVPVWAQTYISRPKTDTPYNYDFTVYRAALAS